jgi:hypothetical protein
MNELVNIREVISGRPDKIYIPITTVLQYPFGTTVFFDTLREKLKEYGVMNYRWWTDPEKREYVLSLSYLDETPLKDQTYRSSHYVDLKEQR